MIGRAILALLALAGPVAAAAQDGAPDDMAAMKALETAIPRQSWYPDGYYDVRIAAEAQVAEFPRPATDLPATPDRGYNLVACNAEKIGFDASDPLMARYGNTALEVARLGAELRRMNYPASLYAEPLLAFERDRLAAADGQSVDDPYSTLADALEAARARLEPGLSSVFAFDECTPPPGAAPPPRPTTSPKPTAAITPRAAPGVTFATQPPAGEVLMINAFAFKVCVRKQPNPWDRFACRWNEIETGIARPMSGRFVYQVTWPDGTVRKGTREIVAPPGTATSVTFRKTGS